MGQSILPSMLCWRAVVKPGNEAGTSVLWLARRAAEPLIAVMFTLSSRPHLATAIAWPEGANDPFPQHLQPGQNRPADRLTLRQPPLGSHLSKGRLRQRMSSRADRRAGSRRPGNIEAGHGAKSMAAGAATATRSGASSWSAMNASRLPKFD